MERASAFGAREAARIHRGSQAQIIETDTGDWQTESLHAWKIALPVVR
eukprot:CAMPEP_0172405552 /NCGR_PEP_ID=MMETSP1061-20121228/67650_1 /TAXON_ID=37318 /ORGANISM="Pseudo-nitzschia pungens, Strain cf. pungens" /LENGTH=47 /DNA_ID= /DNA_START= /DNA_END= /DNA_ORIENTATION=